MSDTAGGVKVALDGLAEAARLMTDEMYWDTQMKWLPKDYVLGSTWLTPYINNMEASLVAVRSAVESAAIRYRLECLQWLTAEAEWNK